MSSLFNLVHFTEFIRADLIDDVMIMCWKEIDLGQENVAFLLSGLFISISFQVVDFESLLSLDLLALTHNFLPTSSDDWILLTLIWA